jgi:hypothetical protein
MDGHVLDAYRLVATFLLYLPAFSATMPLKGTPEAEDAKQKLNCADGRKACKTPTPTGLPSWLVDSSSSPAGLCHAPQLCPDHDRSIRAGR